ncbi:reverse transcriptase domain protein [Apiospora saccharicola]
MGSLHILVSGLWVAYALAAVNSNCTNSTLKNILTNGIYKAKWVAEDALDALNDLSTPTRWVAFNPLFKDQEISQSTLFSFSPRVLANIAQPEVYTSIKDIDSLPLQVTFYCDRKHIVLHPSKNYWYDKKFTYQDKRGATLTAKYRLSNPGDENPSLRNSIAALGYKMPLGNDFMDCVGQAHIYIHPDHLAIPANVQEDNRPLDEVRMGLEEYTTLDQLRPVSETIFHEDVYRFRKCVEVNAIRPLIEPTGIAESYTILAKALSLTPIAGKDAFWSLGAVAKPEGDEDTFAPIPLSSSAKGDGK